MPNARTTFINGDYEIVAASLRPDPGGVSNFTLPQGEDHALSGEEGEGFRIAWQARNEPVSEADFETYAVARLWGDEFRFVSDGQVP